MLVRYLSKYSFKEQITLEKDPVKLVLVLTFDGNSSFFVEKNFVEEIQCFR